MKRDEVESTQIAPNVWAFLYRTDPESPLVVVIEVTPALCKTLIPLLQAAVSASESGGGKAPKAMLKVV